MIKYKLNVDKIEGDFNYFAEFARYLNLDENHLTILKKRGFSENSKIFKNKKALEYIEIDTNSNKNYEYFEKFLNNLMVEIPIEYLELFDKNEYFFGLTDDKKEIKKVKQIFNKILERTLKSTSLSAEKTAKIINENYNNLKMNFSDFSKDEKKFIFKKNIYFDYSFVFGEKNIEFDDFDEFLKLFA